jgi:predicted dehydrogenase
MNETDPPPRVIVTGVGGYGRLHLQNARRLHDHGRLDIVALVDPAVAAQRDHDGDLPIYARLDVALARHRADIVIVATPLDTHADLAEAAMRAGADVLLEKPPVPTLAEFERLLAVQRETGGVVQVGFQSLGSHAVGALADDSLGLGPTSAVSATGLWSRRISYWSRASWAGRRILDGRAVVDGVATNPLAHAVATALRVAGYDTAGSVDSVETDLYRANAIESDDTSVVRVSGDGHPTVTCALTLCALPELHDAPDAGATVTIDGARASASFSYTTDVVTIDGRDTRFDRADLLENLIDHRRTGVPLIVPLESTGAFMRVVEAIRVAPEPTKIDPRRVTWHDEAGDPYPLVDGIVQTVRAAASGGLTFGELGAPWAITAGNRVTWRAQLGGTTVAVGLDGAGSIPFSSPHPYLHPVRTLGGITVTARHPADHDWHVGVSFAVQDAAGHNFWGGRTYVRGHGYQDLDDRGRIEVVDTTELLDGVRHSLAWRGRNGEKVLDEVRELRWRALDAAGRAAWGLEMNVRLLPTGDDAVELGSPGSKGREGAGYGGFFWRFPQCSGVSVFTADAAGEDRVNGSVSPWLAWCARFEGEPEHNGLASVVLAAGDTTTRDPWFARLRDYPGMGSAIAWDAPTRVPRSGLSRSYRAAVIDGMVTEREAASVATLLRSRPRGTARPGEEEGGR